MDRLDLERLNKEFCDKTPEEIIIFALELFDISKIALASSLSIEDQVLTDLLLNTNKKGRIFFLDTGRHFQESYDLMQKTMEKYKFKYEVYAPKTEELENIISENGPNFFYESIEKRKTCCYLRKIEPLNRVLSSVDAWICGLRKDQSITRSEVEIFQWDSNNNIYKINPLANYSESQVWDYVRINNVLFNVLYKQGYKSIGCMPCTRSVAENDDIRSGRWWWEDPDKKECGLHRK